VIDLINLHWWCLVLFICLSSGLFTMWLYGFSFPFPIRLILLPERSSYLFSPLVFPNVGVSSFSLMGMRHLPLENSVSADDLHWTLTDINSK
jgi:hypothetical protein